MIVTPGQPNPYHLDLSGLKILIIDDFADMRAMMRRTVESFLATAIEIARDGDEALEKMAATKFDLVLCDYNLGDGKDGQQILEEAKFRKYITSTTIWMMITAETTVEMVMGALEYKPDDYLTKPFTKQEFALRVMKIQARKKELRDVFLARDAGAFDQALELVAAHLKEKETFELLQIQADLYERLENWTQADAVYQHALTQRAVPWAQLGHARMLIRNKLYDDAKAVLSNAIAQTPTLVEAYDLLAGVHETLGDNASAQNVLNDAITQSPKAILRQKAMARIAYANGDLDAAAKAYRRIIKMGRSSVHRAAEDYTGLARVYAQQGNMGDVAKLFATLREEFKHQPDELLNGVLVEVEVYNKAGANGQVENALDHAATIIKKAKNLSDDVALRFIQAAAGANRHELAYDLAQIVVRNNHDNAACLDKLLALVANTSIHEPVKTLIQESQATLQSVLDHATTLVKQGAIDDAVAHLLKAVTETPRNLSLNLALAQTLVKAMQNGPKTDRLLFLLRQSLDRVRERDPEHALLNTLQAVYRQLMQKKA